MQSERPWLESLVACVPDPLAFAREDWTLLWTNREFARAVGLEQGVKGQGLGYFIEGWEELAKQIARREKNGERMTLAARLFRADGSSADVEIHVARCNPKVEAAWSICVRPVDEVVALRRQLQDRERSHSFLQASTSDLIVRVDEQLTVTANNDAGSAFFPLGASLRKLLHEESQEALIEQQSTGRSTRLDVSLRSRDGHTPPFRLRGFARRLTDDQGGFTGFSLLLHDDSDQLRFARLAERLSLSARETEVVEYLLQGYSNLNIATILGLSESGVKFHIRNVFQRAQVNTRTELMAMMLSE